MKHINFINNQTLRPLVQGTAPTPPIGELFIAAEDEDYISTEDDLLLVTD